MLIILKQLSKYTEYIFLIIIGLLITNTLYKYGQGNFLLSINNYLGFALWLVALVAIMFYPSQGRYGVLILLILSTVNFISFSIETVTSKLAFGIEHGSSFRSIAFNPISFFLLIGYCFLNRKTLYSISNRVFYGSDQELENETRALIDFYHNKFKDCNAQEFNRISENFAEYPLEAQIALKQIRAQKQQLDQSDAATET